MICTRAENCLKKLNNYRRDFSKRFCCPSAQCSKKVLLKIPFKNAILELNGASWRRFLLWKELWEKKLIWSVKSTEMSTDNREVVDRLEYALRRNDISILGHSNYYAQYTSKEEVNVYSESSLNMPTNERKLTKLLPLPMLHVVRLWITRCLSSPLSLCPFCHNKIPLPGVCRFNNVPFLRCIL